MLTLGPAKPAPANVCVVRLVTTWWYNNRGIHQKKSLNYLRRKSSGWNIIEEDCSNGGVDFVFNHIVNLDSCDDGIYEVIACNFSTDWETGYVDYYDYKLIPYEEDAGKISS